MQNPYGHDEHDEVATPRGAVAEYTIAVGAEALASPWILSPFDTWEPNPFYRGPRVPHPESDEALSF